MNVGREPIDTSLLVRMRDSMLHRGPDDEGIWIEDGVGLAHRRLSIIDLSPTGHQPMTTDDENLWLVFNGEIYNYVELGHELEALGHRFRSKCDSEVILHAYQEYGRACLDKFNGMFAFAIWDRRSRSLFAARDPIGIKPFYYHWNGRRLIFASEIKAILTHPEVRREADPLAIADYLFAGQPLAGRTFFKGIEELRPGHALTLEGDSVRTWPYWSIQYDYQHGRRDEDLIDETAALIDDAVRIHCRSDATLGCHLSGGLDSSTVACLTAKHRGDVESFSIRSPGGSFYDETEYAKAVSRHAPTIYREGVADATDVERLTPKLLWHMDQPMATPGGINYHSTSRLASQYVKVSLTGHGGDEVFAGYPAQFRVAFGTTSMFAPTGDPNRPSMSRWYRVKNRLRREGVVGLLMHAGTRTRTAAPTMEQLWVQMHCSWLPSVHPHVDPAFVARLGGYSPEPDYLAAFRGAETDEPLDRCLHHDLRCYLPGLLHMEDRVSMAVSLESRVPLLDRRLVEFLATIPPEQKVRDRVPKRLLRDAGSRWLPPEVLNRRDKAGFPIPITSWLEGELAGDLRRLFGSKASRERGIFDARVLTDRNFLVTDGWKALNVELWFRIFIDQTLDPATPLSEIE